MYFSTQQLVTMFKLQAKANSVMSDSWLTSSNDGDEINNESAIPYYRAAHLEASEAIGHLGFKWWKKESENVEQAILELVDILHFCLSDIMRDSFKTKMMQEGINFSDIENPQEFLQESLMETCEVLVDEDYNIDIFEDKETKIRALEIFIERTLNEDCANLYDCIDLFIGFNCNPNKIYNMYVGKNALNIFRNENGQRDNKYIKIWNGVEDNIYLEKYFEAIDMENDSVSLDDLNNYLSKQYAIVQTSCTQQN